MNTKKVILSTVLSVSSIMSSAVYAEVYLGASIGTGQYKVDLSGVPGERGDFEDSGTATKIYGGYNFNKYFAAEATNYNFAEASVGAFETTPGGPVVTGAAVSMKGFGAYAVGMYPVSKEFNLMAKLGLLSWDADISANGRSASNSGTDAAYGIAASYAFTKELLALAEWEGFQSDNPELSMFSLGFRYVFK